ncbi:hypothetical protein QTU67_003642 [Vibrio cholerae]|nr:hypothetical protein [Vibrio cholerae]EJO2021561.1 hypothetical protein [Vibrio vulnificus]KAA3490917.1 hypothetical protein Y058_19580 [Vibrio mimicus]PXA66124.1 hypothetical protein DMC15_16710 [Vibrio sp. 11986-1-5]RBM34496.1 hypothetical protein DLR62_18550 [Vibrio tarriae]RBM85921.1 hypothetical protein DLR73_13875 [Vibrio paracholerae]
MALDVCMFDAFA